jgi:serine phosphatase RsbU (regulator of sigma subunit)
MALLLEVLCQSKADLSAQEMMDLIIRDVHAFVGNVESYDDMTIVVVRVI